MQPEQTEGAGRTGCRKNRVQEEQGAGRTGCRKNRVQQRLTEGADRTDRGCSQDRHKCTTKHKWQAAQRSEKRDEGIDMTNVIPAGKSGVCPTRSRQEQPTAASVWARAGTKHNPQIPTEKQ